MKFLKAHFSLSPKTGGLTLSGGPGGATPGGGVRGGGGSPAQLKFKSEFRSKFDLSHLHSFVQCLRTERAARSAMTTKSSLFITS